MRTVGSVTISILVLLGIRTTCIATTLSGIEPDPISDSCYVANHFPAIMGPPPPTGTGLGDIDQDFELPRVLGDIPRLQGAGLLNEIAKVRICYRINGTAPVTFTINNQISKTLNPAREWQPWTQPAPLLGTMVSRWTFMDFDIPVSVFNWATPDTSSLSGFPSGTPTPGNNTIRVHIADPLGMQIDWISIRIQCASPIVFVHGWNGSYDTWTPWTGFMNAIGLPWDMRADLGKSRPLTENMADIEAEIRRMQNAYGVGGISMVGHSKGGIVSRAWVGAHKDSVEHMVTIATGFRGTPLPDNQWYSVNEPFYRKTKLLAIQKKLKHDGALGVGFRELSPSFLTAWKNVTQWSAHTKYDAVVGVWDGGGHAPTTQRDQLVWALRTLRIVLVHLGYPLNDGVVPYESAHSFAPSAHYHDFSGEANTAQASHSELPQTTTIASDILHPNKAFGELAVAPLGPAIDTEPAHVAQLETRGDFIVGATAVLDSALCSDSGYVSCLVYGSDSTTKVSVRFPGTGWVDSARAEGDTTLTFARTQLFGTNVTVVRAIANTPGQIVYRCERPFAASTDTAFYAALAYAENPSGWVKLAADSESVAQGDRVTLAMQGVNGTGCTSCVDTAFVYSPSGTGAVVLMRDDGVSPDDVSGDHISHGITAALSESGRYGFSGKRTCRDGASDTCRVSTDATACNVIEAPSGESGTSGVIGPEGQYAALYADLPIEMVATGRVMVFAQLMKDTTLVASAANNMILSAGSRTIQVRFAGRAIYNAGIDGPFVIKAYASVQRDSTDIDVMMSDVATSAYPHTDFEHDVLRLNGAITWRGVDADADGAFDTLLVRVPMTSEIEAQVKETAVLRDSLGHSVPCLSIDDYVAVGDTAITLRWPGETVGAAGLSGSLWVTEFDVTQVVGSGIPAWCRRDTLGTLAAVSSGEFEEGIPDSLRAWAISDVVALCPIGDRDSLQVKVKMPVAFGMSASVPDHVIVAIRTGTTGGTVTLWKDIGSGTTVGDSLQVTRYNDADTTATLGCARGSGCGVTSWQVYVDGMPVGVPVAVVTRSLDANVKALGSVDRFDQADVNAAVGVTSGGCLDLDGSGGTVAAADSSLVAAHSGHHIPRAYVWPTGSLVYAPGDTIRIGWRAGLGDSAKVTIRAIRGATTDTTLIRLNEPDTGSYVWTVPSTLWSPGHYKIQVVHTAGNYKADYKDVGIVAGDTTISIRPLPAASLASSTGRHSWRVTWLEPTQNSGQESAHYDIRINPSGTINESNFASLDTLVQDSPPGPGTTAHCLGSLSPYQSQCHAYRVAIKTKLGDLWSKMVVADFSTRCTGNFEAPGCVADNGLMAGGGGEGGGEELLRHEQFAATSSLSRGATADVVEETAASENSLCDWAKGSYIVDHLRIPLADAETDSGYAVRLRQSAPSETDLDLLSLGYVDHPDGTKSYSWGSGVLVGSSTSVEAAWYADSASVVRTPTSEEPFGGTRGTTLLVSLGPPRSDRGLVVGARALSRVTYDDSTGIAVQTAPLGVGWQTVATIHPRRSFDQFALPLRAGQQARLVFYGDYEVGELGELTIADEVNPTPLTLTSAIHSAHGDVGASVLSPDNEVTTLQMGDTLSLRYGLVSANQGEVRDLYLTAKARNNSIESSSLRAGVAPNSEKEWVFGLGQARPNPSAGDFTIDFTLAKQMPIQLRVYDVAGRLVRTLVNESLQAGPHVTVWDGKNDDGRRVAASVYFYRMVAGSFVSDRKAVLLAR